MLRPRHVLLLAGSLCACDAQTVEPVGGDAGVVFLTQVELTRQCDRVGAVEVQMRARRVSSEPLEILGDLATCPSAEVERLMAVEVDRPGQYLVDVIVRFATGDPVTECLEEEGEPEVLVTAVEVDAGANRILAGTRQPCPQP